MTRPVRGVKGDRGTRVVKEVPVTVVASGEETAGTVVVSTKVPVTWGVVTTVAEVPGDTTVNTRVRVFSIDGLLTVTMYCPGWISTRNP